MYWPDDDEYYPCTIREQRWNHSPSHPGYVFELHYENGEVEKKEKRFFCLLLLSGTVLTMVWVMLRSIDTASADAGNRNDGRGEEAMGDVVL